MVIDWDVLENIFATENPRKMVLKNIMSEKNNIYMKLQK